MTYVASFFHAFSSMGILSGLFFYVRYVLILYTFPIILDQAETVSRRVEKFAELMQSVWLSKNDYERRVRAVCPPSLSFDL